MKLKIIDQTGKSGAEVELPVQFNEPVRNDLIKKAVLAIQNNNRQDYGAMKGAGMRHSADLSKRRRKYRGSYGHGISRVPRKILSRRGTQMFWVGAIISSTVGGRRAHPPKPEKDWNWKINTKEKRKAICSAMSATVIKALVEKRGHKVPDNYPFIINDSFESITKTKELIETLKKIGFKADLKRANDTKIRAGKGKLRGRKKIVKKSLLLVVSDAVKISKATKNIPGVDVVNVKKINAEMLAPGTHPGRATLYTNKAIELLKQGLFTKNYKGEQSSKAAGLKKSKIPLKYKKKEVKQARTKKKQATEKPVTKKIVNKTTTAETTEVKK